MSKKKRNEVLIGGFITAGTGLFLLLLFLMGSLDVFFASTEIVEADFGDVQSLQVGDAVYIFGERVGKVADITLLPGDEAKRAVMRVALKIPRDRRDYLREDSIVKVEKSLTGNISVLILDSDGKKLPRGARLRGTPVADFSTVTQKANQVLEEGDKVVEALNRIVGEIESKRELQAAVSDASEILKKLRQDLTPLTDKLRQTIELVQGTVEENRLDLRHTVANLKESTGKAKDLMDKLNATPDQIARSLAELEKAGAEVAGVLRENRVHIDSILEDLRLASTSAAGLTADIKRRPWRLLYKPSADEEKAMELYDAAWAYNLGATELNRSIRDLTAHLKDDPSGTKRPQEIEEARQRLAHDLRKYREAEEVFWGRLKTGE